MAISLQTTFQIHNLCIANKNSFRYVSGRLIGNNHPWVQVMAWRRIDDTPLMIQLVEAYTFCLDVSTLVILRLVYETSDAYVFLSFP